MTTSDELNRLVIRHVYKLKTVIRNGRWCSEFPDGTPGIIPNFVGNTNTRADFIEFVRQETGYRWNLKLVGNNLPGKIEIKFFNPETGLWFSAIDAHEGRATVKAALKVYGVGTDEHAA